jgi:hypothetical protein
MADDVANETAVHEPDPSGLLSEGATKYVVMLLAAVALAGISAGAWLRWRR